jgi:hypothetical protein
VKHPVTPDGRYFVCGRLWRMANPSLAETKRGRRLMGARRAVHDAKMNADLKAEAVAHKAEDEVKWVLGEQSSGCSASVARSGGTTVRRT